MMDWYLVSGFIFILGLLIGHETNKKRIEELERYVGKRKWKVKVV